MLGSPLLVAWLVTVLVEVPVVAAVFPGQRRRLALGCLVATSATNLTMNGLLPSLLGSYSAVLLVGEFGALVSEAAVYAWLSRPHDVPRALVAAGSANAASYLLGIALLW